MKDFPMAPEEYVLWIADREHVMSEIALELDAQIRQWGGPNHDDTHVDFDWIQYIHKQLNKFGRVTTHELEDDALIKIAALAISAVLSKHRKRLKEDKARACG